ncbi:hypothetical protein ACTI_07420 [Actinoplanes sp. OR16]|nr:hypothetical protein ACTI_07420 [Actinoplanes sp. OR16]
MLTVPDGPAGKQAATYAYQTHSELGICVDCPPEFITSVNSFLIPISIPPPHDTHSYSTERESEGVGRVR